MLGLNAIGTPELFESVSNPTVSGTYDTLTRAGRFRRDAETIHRGSSLEASAVLACAAAAPAPVSDKRAVALSREMKDMRTASSEDRASIHANASWARGPRALVLLSIHGRVAVRD